MGGDGMGGEMLSKMVEKDKTEEGRGRAGVRERASAGRRRRVDRRVAGQALPARAGDSHALAAPPPLPALPLIRPSSRLFPYSPATAAAWVTVVRAM